jgi:hypothetical protein
LKKRREINKRTLPFNQQANLRGKEAERKRPNIKRNEFIEKKKHLQILSSLKS